MDKKEFFNYLLIYLILMVLYFAVQNFLFKADTIQELDISTYSQSEISKTPEDLKKLIYEEK